MNHDMDKDSKDEKKEGTDVAAVTTCGCTCEKCKECEGMKK